MFNNKKHVQTIVIGNEKGGVGKTTISIHLIAYLLKLGFKVASFDLDIRQSSLSRYIKNRYNYNIKNNLNLELPKHYIVNKSNALNIELKATEEKANFNTNFNEAIEDNDFIIIDTPGSNTLLSQFANSYADIIITPVNDSFVDLDVIAHFDPESYKVVKPSIYSEAIWEQKVERAKRDLGEIDWVLVRNRLTNINANNKINIVQALNNLSNKVGLRNVNGFSERVIFRELFLKGLTVLDLNNKLTNMKITISHLAAREELKSFLYNLRINRIIEKLKAKQNNFVSI